MFRIDLRTPPRSGRDDALPGQTSSLGFGVVLLFRIGTPALAQHENHQPQGRYRVAPAGDTYAFVAYPALNSGACAQPEAMRRVTLSAREVARDPRRRSDH